MANVPDVIIDTAALHDKLNLAMFSDNVQKQCKEFTREETRQNTRAAGQMFLYAYDEAVSRSSLSSEAKEAVLGWGLTDVGEYSDGDMFIIAMPLISTYRPSLWPEGYPGGIDDIISLLNDGYSASDRVYGVWPGHGSDVIASRTSFGGAHFIEQAVNDFKGNYAYDYNVISVDIEDRT